MSRRRDPELYARIESLLQSGYAQTGIAAVVGIAPGTVCSIVRTLRREKPDEMPASRNSVPRPQYVRSGR